MQLTTDYAITTDKAFKVFTKLYASDEAKFFQDFSKAFTKCVPPLSCCEGPRLMLSRRLIELGVPVAQFSEVVSLKKIEDQVPVKA